MRHDLTASRASAEMPGSSVAIASSIAALSPSPSAAGSCEEPAAEAPVQVEAPAGEAEPVAPAAEAEAVAAVEAEAGGGGGGGGGGGANAAASSGRSDAFTQAGSPSFQMSLVAVIDPVAIRAMTSSSVTGPTCCPPSTT